MRGGTWVYVLGITVEDEETSSFGMLYYVMLMFWLCYCANIVDEDEKQANNCTIAQYRQNRLN